MEVSGLAAGTFSTSALSTYLGRTSVLISFSYSLDTSAPPFSELPVDPNGRSLKVNHAVTRDNLPNGCRTALLLAHLGTLNAIFDSRTSMFSSSYKRSRDNYEETSIVSSSPHVSLLAFTIRFNFLVKRYEVANPKQ